MKVKTLYWGVVAVLVLALYLLINTPPNLVSTYSNDVNRFGPDSVDIQMASGTLQYDPPHMLAPAPSLKPLLLFPPSQQDLEKLSGPSASVQY
jgi:hypothetical protein